MTGISRAYRRYLIPVLPRLRKYLQRTLEAKRKRKKKEKKEERRERGEKKKLKRNEGINVPRYRR